MCELLHVDRILSRCGSFYAAAAFGKSVPGFMDICLLLVFVPFEGRELLVNRLHVASKSSIASRHACVCF